MTTATLTNIQTLPSADATVESAKKKYVHSIKWLRAYAKRVFTVSEKHRNLTQQSHWGDCW